MSWPTLSDSIVIKPASVRSVRFRKVVRNGVYLEPNLERDFLDSPSVAPNGGDMVINSQIAKLQTYTYLTWSRISRKSYADDWIANRQLTQMNLMSRNDKLKASNIYANFFLYLSTKITIETTTSAVPTKKYHPFTTFGHTLKKKVHLFFHKYHTRYLIKHFFMTKVRFL